ncbi:hypothetical protein QUA70_11900 [Microcoleus sp. LAD1_D5]|uniref:hypothetical protein n=1 Tax=unclassified Microcoleus TaxID=2642155 RepID=UPI002FD3FE4F
MLEEIQPFGDTNFAITNAHYENVKVGDSVNLRPKGPTLDDLVRSDFERVDYVGIS